MAAVTAELDLEISRLRQKLGQANSRLDKFAADARKKGSTFASNFHAGMGNLLKGGLAGLAVGAGVAGLLAGKTFSDSIKAAMDDEQFGVSVEVLVGDAGRAKDLIAQLRKDAASTPLSFGDLGGAAKQLLAFGENAESVPSTLRRIGDVSTAIQAPIGEIAEIYGKARVQGTLFAEDINQLTGRGIPVIQEFARQLGVGESQVKKMGSEGKITFDMLQKAFVDLTSEGGKFGGMMERQAGTIGGLWSTFLDNVQALRLEFGKPIAESLKPILEDGIGLLETMKVKAAEWGQAIATGIDYARAAFQELSGGELLAMAGNGLKLAFMEAVNLLARGLKAVFAAAQDAEFMGELGNRLESAALLFKEIMLSAAAEVSRALAVGAESLYGGKKNRFAVAFSNAAGLAEATADLTNAEREALEENAPKSSVDLGKRFAEHFGNASDILSTEEVRAKLREDAQRVRARAQRNKAEREKKAEEAGGAAPAPENVASGPMSYSAGGVQNAVNALFGRPMEAEAKRQTSLLASIDNRLRNIEADKPKPQRPPVPGPQIGVGVFAPA